MLKTINGSAFLELVESGMKNLDIHKRALNDLNVFPVPDGDTGTNMLMTVKQGVSAADGQDRPLSETSERIASVATFGARGNSGVIFSQFLKGISEGFYGISEADSVAFSKALTLGYKRAYASVAKPVEGTMLTVLREAALALEKAPADSIDEAISVYLDEARRSLDRTPELLPILKKAGVVDSGGSGVVCFFEGMQKFLRGEEIESQESEERVEQFDFSLVNKDTKFDFGYCAEELIQLKRDPSEFDHEAFKRKLDSIGDSIVSNLIGDKLKLHIHTKNLSRLMAIIQDVGEILTIKIENMTLQHLEKKAKEAPVQKFLLREDEYDCDFAVIAAAPNRVLQGLFSEMGCDVVICSEMAPSSQDFIDAFKLVSKKSIIVFPNSSNSILTSMQAGTMYRDADVRIINCRSNAECYSALSIMDFDADAAEAIISSKKAIASATEFSVYLASKDVRFGNKKIEKNEFFSISNENIVEVGRNFLEVTLDSLKKIAADREETSLITVFYSEILAEEYIEHVTEKIDELGLNCEIAAVPAGAVAARITVMCE